MDELSKDELDQLLAVFREQSVRILDEMADDLLALEAGGADPEVMTRLRRAAHTIKGDSACVGFDGVTEVAHKIEDVFDAVLNGEVRLERRVVDLVLLSLDALRAVVGGEEVTDLAEHTVASLLTGLGKISFESGVSVVQKGEMLKHPEPIGSNTQSKSEEVEHGARRRREFVRIEAPKLDALLNLAGEMVIARSVLNQAAPEIERALEKHEMAGGFNGAHAQMGKLIAELQKSVLKMRMVTIDNVFKRFARPMRELASARGKQVELEFRGGETELDRALVDLLYEPLLHLLRNAVDHGVEVTAERIAGNKPRVGKIALCAYHEGNQVVVEVSDDGRGLDPARLRRRAVELGAISKVEAEQMDDEEALELIFREGFSTSKQITRLSGRGIGASAVKSAIEQLRGTVSLRSQPGLGTTFVLRMPLTLAIIRALLFKAGARLFALPLLSVSEIVRVRPNEIRHIDGFETYRLRDRFISVVKPCEVFGFERRKGGIGSALRADTRHLFVIVLTIGSKRYGLVADELIGEQELVIKPLDSSWVQNDALAGASVVGDGRVVLILDAEMVFRRAVKHQRNNGPAREAYAG
ncbi:MAG TPA: chemotaxis protein CheA [Blastocatellia bacterium]|nr:chemotaxis protein CheA [Blastocatellia bacterium]